MDFDGRSFDVSVEMQGDVSKSARTSLRSSSIEVFVPFHKLVPSPN